MALPVAAEGAAVANGAGEKRRMIKRMTTKAATASKAIIRKLPIASPMPKWLIKAAMPKPAAKPASGPIHERLAGAAATPGLAGAACCGVACAGAAGLAGVASGAVRAGMLRWVPAELPPPKRLACASEGAKLRATAASSTPRIKVFIDQVLLKGHAASAAVRAHKTCAARAIV